MIKQQEVGAIAAYYLNVGDEVAVLPIGYTSERAVLDVLKVRYVGGNSIELTNSQLYARFGGHGLTTSDYIVLATDEHCAALKRKRKRTRSRSRRLEVAR